MLLKDPKARGDLPSNFDTWTRLLGETNSTFPDQITLGDKRKDFGSFIRKVHVSIACYLSSLNVEEEKRMTAEEMAFFIEYLMTSVKEVQDSYCVGYSQLAFSDEFWENVLRVPKNKRESSSVSKLPVFTSFVEASEGQVSQVVPKGLERSKKFQIPNSGEKRMPKKRIRLAESSDADDSESYEEPVSSRATKNVFKTPLSKATIKKKVRRSEPASDGTEEMDSEDIPLSSMRK